MGVGLFIPLGHVPFSGPREVLVGGPRGRSEGSEGPPSVDDIAWAGSSAPRTATSQRMGLLVWGLNLLVTCSTQCRQT